MQFKNWQLAALLTAGAFAAWVTAYHPAVGTPLMAGIGVVSVIKLLWDRDTR